MKDLELLSGKQWHPLSYLGVTHPFFAVDKATVINTWISLAALCVLIIIARLYLKRQSSIGRYIVLSYVRSFIDLCTQSLGHFSYKHSLFILSIFSFILTCNCIAIIPWVEEPTKELNTTFALGLISFFYIQMYGIKAHGIGGYIREYFTPFFFMFPLHVIGKLSTIISISFRLFGNIFGGATIMHIYHVLLTSSPLFEIIGIASGVNILMVSFFILFEGILQAFVFTMLTVTYLAIALSHDEEIGEMT